MAGPVKVIHRFWAGPEMPAAYAQHEQEWQRLNPDHTVTTWTESDVSQFPAVADVVSDLYARGPGRLYAQIAAVLAPAIVEAVGGIYVACNVQPVRPLVDLPGSAWAAFESYESWRVADAVIGSPTAHDPFWRDFVAALPLRYFSNPEAIGPAFLTDMVRDTHRQFHVLSKETFHVHGDIDDLPEAAIAFRP